MGLFNFFKNKKKPVRATTRQQPARRRTDRDYSRQSFDFGDDSDYSPSGGSSFDSGSSSDCGGGCD